MVVCFKKTLQFRRNLRFDLFRAYVHPKIAPNLDVTKSHLNVNNCFTGGWLSIILLLSLIIEYHCKSVVDLMIANNVQILLTLDIIDLTRFIHFPERFMFD